MLKAVDERNLSTQGSRIGLLEIDIYYIILHYVTYHLLSVGLRNPFRHVEKINRKSLIRLCAKHVSFNFC